MSKKCTKLSCLSSVLMQTLNCVVSNKGRKKHMRTQLDCGLQRSYILKKTAEELV